MIDQIIEEIQKDLDDFLDEKQKELLLEALEKRLRPLKKEDLEQCIRKKQDMLPVFIAAKRVEGCSEKSLRYYESTIRNMLESIDKTECDICTEDLRA